MGTEKQQELTWQGTVQGMDTKNFLSLSSRLKALVSRIFFFLLVQGPVATGNNQICFVLMDKEASNYAFPRHAVSMHPVPLLVMHVVVLFCVKLPYFDRVPEIRQFLSLVTFCNSLNKAGTLYSLRTNYCFTQQ